jgi:prevent-host-death family protein
MITVGVSDFRAAMNTFLQKVQNGEIIILTSRGVEIAKLVPPDFAQYSARQELKHLRETAIVGDVLSPVEDEVNWNAAQ